MVQSYLFNVRIGVVQSDLFGLILALKVNLLLLLSDYLWLNSKGRFAHLVSVSAKQGVCAYKRTNSTCHMHSYVL